MAVPRREVSRTDTRTRRSIWEAGLTEFSTVKVAGREVRIPRHLVRAYKSSLLGIEA